MTQIQYGRKKDERHNNNLCGFAIFEETNQFDKTVKIELVCATDGLYVYEDSKLIGFPGKSAGYKYIMVWTKVAGWLGTASLLRSLKQ